MKGQRYVEWRLLRYFQIHINSQAPELSRGPLAPKDYRWQKSKKGYLLYFSNIKIKEVVLTLKDKKKNNWKLFIFLKTWSVFWMDYGYELYVIHLTDFNVAIFKAKWKRNDHFWYLSLSTAWNVIHRNMRKLIL